MRGEGIVAAARGWIGTPYLHQGSARGIGCDCLGLVRGVWREILGSEPEAVPVYPRDWGEAAGDERLLDAARRHLSEKPLADEAIGDVLLFRMRTGRTARHVGLAARIGAEASFVHSYQGHGVVESALTPPWRRRIAARFAFLDGSS